MYSISMDTPASNTLFSVPFLYFYMSFYNGNIRETANIHGKNLNFERLCLEEKNIFLGP